MLLQPVGRRRSAVAVPDGAERGGGSVGAATEPQGRHRAPAPASSSVSDPPSACSLPTQAPRAVHRGLVGSPLPLGRRRPAAAEALAWEAAELLIAHRATAPAWGAAIRIADGYLVLLHGAVRAEIDTPAGRFELSGAQDLTWVDRRVLDPIGRIALSLTASGEIVADPRSDLRGGLVPAGSGLVLSTGAAAADRPDRTAGAPRPAGCPPGTRVAVTPRAVPPPHKRRLPRRGRICPPSPRTAGPSSPSRRPAGPSRARPRRGTRKLIRTPARPVPASRFRAVRFPATRPASERRPLAIPDPDPVHPAAPTSGAGSARRLPQAGRRPLAGATGSKAAAGPVGTPIPPGRPVPLGRRRRDRRICRPRRIRPSNPAGRVESAVRPPPHGLRRMGRPPQLRDRDRRGASRPRRPRWPPCRPRHPCRPRRPGPAPPPGPPAPDCAAGAAPIPTAAA